MEAPASPRAPGRLFRLKVREDSAQASLKLDGMEEGYTCVVVAAPLTWATISRVSITRHPEVPQRNVGNSRYPPPSSRIFVFTTQPPLPTPGLCYVSFRDGPKVEAFKDRVTFVHLYGPEPHPTLPATNFDQGIPVNSYWSTVAQPTSYPERLAMLDRVVDLLHPDEVSSSSVCV